MTDGKHAGQVVFDLECPHCHRARLVRLVFAEVRIPDAAFPDGIELRDTSPLVEDLAFSVRAYNVAKNAGCTTARDLAALTRADVMRLKNCGHGTLREFQAALAKHGLQLRESR